MPQPSEQPPSPKPRSPKPRSALQGALTLMMGTLASRITGLLRSSLLNQLFSKESSDAFLVASKIPNLFRELLAEGALTNAFVPIYKKCSSQGKHALAGSVLAILVVINSLLLLGVWLLAPWIVDLLLSESNFVNRELTITLTRICFPFLSAISLSAWVMGILQAEEHFLAPAWAPVAFNIVHISLMLSFPQQANWLALAFTLGGIAQLMLQLPALRHHDLLPSFNQLWHPRLSAVIILMLPFLFTTSGRQILNVLSNRLLSGISEGAVTAFFNADLFLSLALGLFSISPALAYYSRLADNISHAPEQFADTLLEGLRFIALLTIPAGLILWVFAEPAVQVVFNWLSLFQSQGNNQLHEGADPAVLRLSVEVLMPLGLAVFPIGLNNLLMRSFYVREQVRLPVLLSLIFLSLQALLYLLLTPHFGIAGLAWATVVASWLQCITLNIVLQQQQRLNSQQLPSYSGRLWLLAGAIAGITYGMSHYLPVRSWWGYFALASGGVLSFAILYLTGCYFLKVPEVRQLVARLKIRRR